MYKDEWAIEHKKDWEVIRRQTELFKRERLINYINAVVESGESKLKNDN